MSIAIVIPCYDRPSSLERLLSSLSKAVFNEVDISLIISIDSRKNKKVIEIAQNYEWKHGSKEVIIHEEQLGLKNHIYFCGDLTEKYENLIILEDDLFVSPYFYDFAIQAFNFYKDEERVAGISLYNYEVTENLQLSFKPVDDGSDVYFLQFASSWGQLFSKNNWRRFREWNKINEDEFQKSSVPGYVKDWGENSWKKHFIHFLMDQDKYFVYPKLSLTTNFNQGGGTHSDPSINFQTSIQNTQKQYVFQQIEQSKAIYDAWFEITAEGLNKMSPVFEDYDYEVDLYGAKEAYRKEYVLTTRKATDSLYSFSNKMVPILQNILSGTEGSAIKFSLARNVEINKPDHLVQQFFTVVIPVIDFKAEELKFTLDSVFASGYYPISIAVVINQQLIPLVEKLVADHFQNYKQDFQFIDTSEKDLGFDLKSGFDKINNGIITWLNPGSILAANIFSEMNKVFSIYQQINWVFTTGDEEAIRKQRLNLVIALHLLPSQNAYLIPELMFFRAHSWKLIGDKLKNVINQDFFSLWVFNIVANFDLHPILIEGVKKKALNHSYLSVVPKQKLLESIDPQQLSNNLKKKINNKVVFRFLRYAYLHQIPGLRNLFTMYYDLPLVLRKDKKNGGYYLSKV